MSMLARKAKFVSQKVVNDWFMNGQSKYARIVGMFASAD